MEQKLHDEAKRQRRAVESSELNVLAEAVTVPLASSTTSTTAAATTTKMAVDDDADDGTGADHLSPELAPEGDVQERGARRPPPVNSEILPLPWSGRLGYVRMPGHQICGHLPI